MLSWLKYQAFEDCKKYIIVLPLIKNEKKNERNSEVGDGLE